MVERRTTDDVLNMLKKRGNGLRACIDRKCAECIYDKWSAGSWRQQVTDCTSYQCPLYPVRPTTRPRKEKDDE